MSKLSAALEERKRQIDVINKVENAKLDKQVEADAQKLVADLNGTITLEEATEYYRILNAPRGSMADKLGKMKAFLAKLGGGASGDPQETLFNRALHMWDYGGEDYSPDDEPPRSRVPAQTEAKRPKSRRRAFDIPLRKIEVEEPDLPFLDI
jgi:hypothetical protein